MKKAKKVLLILVGMAVYLNIGWAFGDRVYDIAFNDPSEIQTVTDKFLSGPGQWTVDLDTPEDSRVSRTLNNLILSVLWPITFVAITASWILSPIF